MPLNNFHLYKRIQELLDELSKAQHALVKISEGKLTADECKKVAKEGLMAGFGLVGSRDGE